MQGKTVPIGSQAIPELTLKPHPTSSPFFKGIFWFLCLWGQDQGLTVEKVRAS